MPGETLESDEFVTLELSREVYEDLARTAQRRQVSVEEVLRDALANGLSLLRESTNGTKILIRRPGADLEELIPA